MKKKKEQESDKELKQTNRELTPAATAAAEFFCQCLCHRHRGVVNCDDKVLIYGNDCYADDPRSRREVELLIQRLKQLEIFKHEFGLSSDGNTWALLIRNYRGDDIPMDDLVTMVTDAWVIACEEQRTRERDGGQDGRNQKQ